MARFTVSHGLHKPACGGRCLNIGWTHEDSFAHISFIMVAAPTGLWAGFVLPYLYEEYHFAIMIPSAVFFVCATAMLLAAFCTEPGILPTIDAPPDASAVLPGGRSRKLVILGGTNYELSSKRAKMVRETDNCVENFDHFCPWVSNVVGRRNYRWFVLFLVATNVLALYITLTAVLFLVAYVGVVGGLEAAVELKPVACLVALVLAIYGISILLCVGGLLSYHLSLIAKAETTNEEIKDVYRETVNPNDFGCFENFSRFLCGGVPNSYVSDRPGPWPVVPRAERNV